MDGHVLQASLQRLNSHGDRSRIRKTNADRGRKKECEEKLAFLEVHKKQGEDIVATRTNIGKEMG